VDLGSLALVTGEYLLKAVLPGLAAAGGTLAVGILNKQLRRAGIELTDKQQQQVRTLVENAIVQTEELARRRALAGDPMTSEEKRQETTVRVMVERPDLREPDIFNAIDALLPKVRQIIPATRLPAAAPLAAAPSRRQ
jgi:hypothetical protein